MRSVQKITAAFILLAASLAWAGNEGPRTSYMGVDVEDVSSDRVQALKLKNESGVEITMVDNDAPAGKAGLKEHDVILQFNGSNVDSVEQLRRMIRETPPGRTVALAISRDGNPQTVNVTLAARSDVYKVVGPHGAWNVPAVPPVPPVPPIHIEIPDMNWTMMSMSPSRIGVVVESLTPQLGEYFGVKNGEGLLVRSVEKGSPAEAAGLKAGDVVVSVDGQRVSDRSDWRSTLRNKTGKVPVGILREKRAQTLTLTLPDRKQSSGGRTIIIPGDEIEMEMAELADMAPDMVDLAMMKADVEIAKSSKEVKKSMSKMKTEMKREVERRKEELKREQKEMKQEQKEQQKEMLKDKEKDNDNDRDEDNEDPN